MGDQPRVVQFVGYSNSGKTTLLAKLIPGLEREGIRVGVIKHDGGHDFEWDQPGKDTYRFREAGASIVAIQSATKTAMVEQRPVPLQQLVKRMGEAGADLVLVEGFKREGYPKLVMLRDPSDAELLDTLSDVVAVISREQFVHPVLPVFLADQVEEIVQFLFDIIEYSK
ncbi:molybdopterin-guanine dinucleotide biosynthesis protein B [Brevibacillus sp. H7]|uniref:molybdopterin-guanine dinucleotide biosynthesis protein B n=1 Tax=Brevibacillus sp. H7 TaxID=3349138 RepID=UPI0038236327